MEKQLCQSCGMDMLESNESYGTNADGTLSEDYCHYCYADGNFTATISLDDMISQWVVYMVKENPSLTESEARNQMESIIPNLKRWSA